MLVPDITPTIRRGEFTDGVRIGVGRGDSIAKTVQFGDCTDYAKESGLPVVA